MLFIYLFPFLIPVNGFTKKRVKLFMLLLYFNLLMCTRRLAENGSAEIARKAATRRAGDYCKQAGRTCPPLGHSREGVST